MRSRAELTALTSHALRSQAEMESTRAASIFPTEEIPILIEKGPNSSNGQVIGYAMEVRSSGYNPTQRVHIANNVFISDCTAHAVTHIAMEESPANGWLVAENEFVAGKYMVTIGGSSVDTTISESNVYYDSRNSANLGPYSDLPAPPCTN